MSDSGIRADAMDNGLPARRHGLDRRMILDAGADFIEAHGLRALSMRRLGAALGVEAMSLYRHVPSRDNLLDGIVEVVLDDLYGDPEVYLEPKHGWQDYLVRLAHGLRRVALARPQIFPLIATRPPQAPWIRPPLRSLRWIDSFLGALCSAGFRDDAAVAAYRAFSSFLLGHLLLEVAAKGADIAPVEMPEPAGQVPMGLDAYPHVQRLERRLSEDRSAEEFEESLENLLHRIEALHT
jgi:AcrR family transcriptional regulator